MSVWVRGLSEVEALSDEGSISSSARQELADDQVIGVLHLGWRKRSNPPAPQINLLARAVVPSYDKLHLIKATMNPLRKVRFWCAESDGLNATCISVLRGDPPICDWIACS